MKKLTYLCGFLMSFADSIPGISGGTIAYILGLYDTLISSVYTLISKNGNADKKQALMFVIRLLTGWLLGFAISIILIAKLINSHIYEVSSMFLGFIIISIPFIVRSEIKVLKKHKKDFYFILLGLAFVLSITLFNPAQTNSIEPSNLQTYLYFFFVGAIAVSALLLPGISGSTLLLIFGVYFTVINALHEIIKFNFEQLPIIFSFGLGMLLGIYIAIKVIHNAFLKHPGKITYLIIGLMIGSIFAIIKGPTTLEIPLPPLDFSTFSVLFFAFGIGLIYSLELIKKKMNHDEKAA